MAIEPEFVRLMKRWIRPPNASKSSNNTYQQTTSNPAYPSGTSGVKPIQLDDDDDLR